MEDEKFPPNSRTTKKVKPAPVEKDRAKQEKVIEGQVLRRKKPLGARLRETFFGGEDAKGVWGFVMMDVLVPAAKDMVADTVTQAIERSLYGEVQSRGRRSRGGGSRQDYSRMYDEPRGRGRDRDRDRAIRRPVHDFDDIILATRAEAIEVIDRLFDLVNKYDEATVADLYGLVGLSAQYTDEKWGWDDMRGADVRRIRNGYLLDLPRPIQLD